MDLSRFGEHALTGWRERVAAPVAGALSSLTGLRAGQARGLLGVAFFLASAVYVARTLARAARRES